MKKLTIVVVAGILIINVMAWSAINTGKQLSNAQTSMLASIPDDTAYFYFNNDIEDAITKTWVDKISNFDNVKHTKFLNMYNPHFITVQEPASKKTFNLPTFEQDKKQNDQKLVAGTNFTGDKQIIISSAISSFLDVDPSELIGQSMSDLKIVGVYQDPDPLSIHNDKNTTPYITNVSYTNNKYYREKNVRQNKFETNSGHIATKTPGYYQVTFTDSNLAANIKSITDKYWRCTVISSLGISDTSQTSPYPSNPQPYWPHLLSRLINVGIRDSLIAFDIIIVSTLFICNRKEKNE